MKARNRPPRLDAAARGTAAGSGAFRRRPRSCSCGPSIAGKVDEPRPARVAAPGRAARREPGRGVGRDPGGLRRHARGAADRSGVHGPRRAGRGAPHRRRRPRRRPHRVRDRPTRVVAGRPRRAGSLAGAARRRSIDDTDDAGPIRVDGRGPRWLRWIDGVAVVTDGPSLLATTGPTRPRSGCSSPAAPSLVVADGPFAPPRSRAGVEVVAFAGLDRRRSRHPARPGPQRCLVVPVHAGRSPRAYAPLDRVARDRVSTAMRPRPARNSESTQAPRGTLDNFGRSGIQSGAQREE